MEVFKRYKCIEYGKNNRGMLFLMENNGGFEMEDTIENRNSMEEMFNNWKNSFGVDGGCDCSTCWNKYECRHCS